MTYRRKVFHEGEWICKMLPPFQSSTKNIVIKGKRFANVSCIFYSCKLCDDPLYAI